MLKILIGIGLGFLLFSNQGARQTTEDILRFGADALDPEVRDQLSRNKSKNYWRRQSEGTTPPAVP